MRLIGNCTARGVYEANIPEHFRRPQSDSALEAFIRAKYDQKRYIMKDWVKPKVNVEDLPCWDELQDIYKGGSGNKKSGAKHKSSPSQPQSTGTRQQTAGLTRLAGPADKKAAGAPRKSTESSTAPAPTPSALNDLVSLGSPKPASTVPAQPAADVPAGKAVSAVDDLLGLDSAPVVSTVRPAENGNVFSAVPQQGGTPLTPASAGTGAADLASQEQKLLFGGDGSCAGQDSGVGGDKKTKTDILALYGSAQNNATSPAGTQNMFGSFASAPAPHTAVPDQSSMGGFVGYTAAPPAAGNNPYYPQQPMPNVARFGGMGPQPGVVGPQIGMGGAYHPYQNSSVTSTQNPYGPYAGGVPSGMQGYGGLPPGVGIPNQSMGGGQYPMAGLPHQMGGLQLGSASTPAPGHGNTLATNLWQ